MDDELKILVLTDTLKTAKEQIFWLEGQLQKANRLPNRSTSATLDMIDSVLEETKGD